MWRHFPTALLAAQVLLALSSLPALAQGLSFFDSDKVQGIASLGIGAFNVTNEGRGDQATVFQLDLVPDFTLVSFAEHVFVHPYLGGWVTTDAGRMAYGGLQVLVPIGDEFEVRPFLALGAFDEGGGEDLRNTALVHLGVTLFYVTRSGWRFGSSFTHQSHGGMSSGNNPGSNSALINIAVPFDALFR
jgi:hypothetical protein